MAYCGPHVVLGLVRQIVWRLYSLRVSQEHKWRTQREPPLGPVLLEESQAMKGLQELEQSAKLLKQKRITVGFTQAAVGLPVGLPLGVLFGKVFS